MPDLDLKQLHAKWEESQYQRHGPAFGGDFLFGDSIDPTPIWGAGDQVLWAEGEGLMIYGPQGRGKSTLAQQLVNARHGFGPDELLGLPVKQDDRPTLYLAMDRPRQVQRSWRRMVEKDRDWEALNHNLIVWLGPLPFKLTWDDAGMLPAWAQTEFGAGLIVVDSYKDLAPKLTDDETGNLVNRVMQKTLTSGIDWLGLHHPRKSQAQNKKPDSLDDVYGSTWLTSGLGSVIGLWSKVAGEELVEWSHIKQPAEPVSLGMVMHHHDEGHTTAADVTGMPTGASAKDRHAQTLIRTLVSSPKRVTLDEAALIMDLKSRSATDVLKLLVDRGALDEDGSTTGKTWGLA